MLFLHCLKFFVQCLDLAPHDFSHFLGYFELSFKVAGTVPAPLPRPTIILLGVAEFRAAMHVRSSFSVGTALDKLVNKQVLDKVTLNSRVLPRNGLSQTGEGQSDLARSQNDPN